MALPTQEELLVHFGYADGKLTRKSDDPRWKRVPLGSQRPDGYWVVGYKSKVYLIHRVIWCMLKGYWPEELDHINRDNSDNRIENLREVGRSENNVNRVVKPNRLGVRGVHEVRGRYVAQFSKQYLGTYATIEEARERYLTFVKQHYALPFPN